MNKYIAFILLALFVGTQFNIASAQTLTSRMPVYPEGCTSTHGFSSVNGLVCDGSQFPQGCTSTKGYSSTTGIYCNDV